ncbi:MAG: hypothetical protein RR784_02225 [Burkholderiaceae bacterium]
MKLNRITTVSATLALAATLAACGGGSFDSSPGGVTPPTLPTAPQIDSSNYLLAFGVTSVALARADLLQDATDTAFAAALSLNFQAGTFACAKRGSIAVALIGNGLRFEFSGCDDGRHVYDSGVLEASALKSGSFSGQTLLTFGEFTAVNFGYFIAYPVKPDEPTEVAHGAVTVRRAADLSRALSGQFSVLRLGRADTYTDLALGRSAPDANGNTRPALGQVRIDSPRFPFQPLEAGVTFTAIIARAPDGSYLEVTDASAGTAAAYLMRIYRGAGDTAQLSQSWGINDQPIKDALAAALK